MSGTRMYPRRYPVLRPPWNLEFGIFLLSNRLITPDKLLSYFEDGGENVGLLAYRPRFGRFKVTRWDVQHYGRRVDSNE